MEGAIKIWKWSYKVWWGIFFALQVFILVIMIGTLGAKTWAYTKNGLIYYNFFYGSLENAFFNGNSFKGSFTHCTDGCSGDYGTLASN